MSSRSISEAAGMGLSEPTSVGATARDGCAGPAVTCPAEACSLIYGATAAERWRHVLWTVLGQPLLRLTPSGWHSPRRWVLRGFGARVDRTAQIARTIRVHHPWNLSIGAGTMVGDHVILFCLGHVRIGARCVVSQYAHLCAGSHAHTRPDMTLIKSPIVVEDDAWIAADAFIGPGVTIGHNAVVGARATVLHSLPADQISVGDDARPIRSRYRPTCGPEAAAEPRPAPVDRPADRMN